jgi:hypothetical protein
MLGCMAMDGVLPYQTALGREGEDLLKVFEHRLFLG